MNIVIYICLSLTALYLLAKFALYIYRPFGVQKFYNKIDELYEKLLTFSDKDINNTQDRLGALRNKGHKDHDKISTWHKEEDLIEEAEQNRKAKEHEEEVYNMYLRCRERYGMNFKNPDKMTEYIGAYYRYLTVSCTYRRIYEMRMNSFMLHACDSDEMKKEYNEFKISTEECIRKLNTLLAE